MSDGGASGGFDSGSGGGGFDSGSGGTFGSGFGGGPDSWAPADIGPSTGGPGFDPSLAPGSPEWIHQQHLHHHLHTMRHRGGGSLPTSPVGWVVFVLVAIVALVLFATISSTADDLYPGFPSGEVVDGGTVDGDFSIPPAP